MHMENMGTSSLEGFKKSLSRHLYAWFWNISLQKVELEKKRKSDSFSYQ